MAASRGEAFGKLVSLHVVAIIGPLRSPYFGDWAKRCPLGIHTR
jgi:hypothetical protein